MRHLDHNVSKSLWEVPFQIALHIVVFIFYSFDREQPQIQPYQVVFFLNYAVAVFFINYLLLPKFFYQRKYWQFFMGLAVVITLVIVVEEMVLEKIYFPDWRGKHFPGVFYSLLDVLPVITILSGFKFAWDLIRKQREVEKLKLSMEESELKFLKSQINPHFLFNNLNNLYSHALENSPKTPFIILELSSVLRYMLYECKERYVPLSNELKQLENFVKLNELQIEERGSIKFSVAQMNGQQYRIAPLILMVFVENAFKHSTASQVDNISIDIKVDLTEDGRLNFTCENSYHDNANNHDLPKGIGLENVIKRLDLLYPGAYDLQVEDTEGLYKVILSINLN